MKIAEQLHAFVWESMTSNNCNTFFIDGTVKVLVDPGHIAHFDHVQSGLSELGIGISDIGLVIITHAHPDHMEAIQLFKNFSTQITMHQQEWRLVESLGRMLDDKIDINAYMPDFFLTEGDLRVGDIAFDIIHTPGHSPGGVTLYWRDQKALFTGDLIFKDGLGRTDLPGGSSEDIKKSISRVAEWNVDMMLSGHGEIIVGAEQVRNNFDQVMNVWFAYV